MEIVKGEGGGNCYTVKLFELKVMTGLIPLAACSFF